MKMLLLRKAYLPLLFVAAMSPRTWGQTLPSALTARYYASLGAHGNVLGDVTAAVLLEVYSDFQCPHCKAFWQTTMREIQARYVAPGKVRVIAYSMGNRLSERAAGNNESEDAARAAYAAAAQNLYWVYHDLLYEMQGKVNSGTFSLPQLIDCARTAGPNMAPFQTAMASDELKARVARDEQDGRRRGVQTVPTAFINGMMIAGEQPFEKYQAAIEAALAAASKK